MKIVYIPQALYPALKKANLRSQDFGDIAKLLCTLSADDVAFYFYANRAAVCPIPAPLAESFENLAGSPGFTENDAQVQSVISKLLSSKINGTSTPFFEDDAILTSDCMEEDLIIITHTAPSDADVGKKTVENSTVFYDRIIQQLLVFLPAEVIMGLPVLLGWMKSVQADAASPTA